jgi:hypothetical protein
MLDKQYGTDSRRTTGGKGKMDRSIKSSSQARKVEASNYHNGDVAAAESVDYYRKTGRSKGV